MEVRDLSLDSIIPYARNPRKNDGAVDKVAASIKEFGWRSPIVVDEEMVILAGHTRYKAAKKLGLTEVPVHIAEGLTEAQKKAYRIADNRVAEEAEWDEELLKFELEELGDLDFDMNFLGFDNKELSKLLEDSDQDNPYTQKINTPTYEPSGEKPSLEELYDDEKAMDLIVSIQESNLDEKEKKFLMAAASRHIVFNYDKIANFYAHSSQECQELMENSALVIIDFDKAIENGFVKLTQEINDMFEVEEDEE
jgi:hypothetical protein